MLQQSRSARPIRWGLLPTIAAALFALSLSACQAKEHATGSGVGGTFGDIAPGDVVHLVGTEPFWGGEIAKGALRYTTPDKPDGTVIPVSRFAGNNGLGFSGNLQGMNVDLAITPGTCVDGMSDRTYPYVATLRIGTEQRDGCAWTDRQPFKGANTPRK